MFSRKWLVLVLLVVPLAGCHRQTVALPPAPPEHESDFARAMASFREYTPDGYRRAIEQLGRAIARKPDSCTYRARSAEAHLLLALELRQNFEDFQPELTEAGRLLTSCPVDAVSLARLDAFLGLDEFGPPRERAAVAMEQINRAIAAAPGEPLNWFVRWRLNPTTNRQENAILRASEIPDHGAIIDYELGNYYLVKSEYESAREAFKRAIDSSPRHFRAHIGLAQAISALDDAEDVETTYLKAVELAPTFLEGRILLGDYFTGIEEPEKAREQYLAAQAANPRYAVAPLRLGISYIQAGRIDDAEEAFKRVLEINPASFEAYYYMGNVWLARDDTTRAKQHYEEALRFVLNFPEAVYALGTVLFREGKTDQALEQFERVLQINRNHPDAYFSRASIRTQRKQYRDAIDDYNRALGLYDRQYVDVLKQIEQYEQRGLPRKTEAPKRRKERLESLVERARALKMKTEDDLLKNSKRP